MFNKINQISTINVDSKPVVLWKMLFLLIMVLQVIVIPIKISFSLDNLVETNNHIDLFFEISLFTYFIDIFLSFNTSYFHEGEAVYERKLVWSHYVKLDFWIDSLTLAGLMLSS